MGLCGSSDKKGKEKEVRLEGGVQTPAPWQHPTPLPRSQLNKMRREFWETQPAYGGSAEIWTNLQAAVEQPDMRAIILESSGIIMPSKNWREIYDSTGYRYELPPYIVSDPTNVVEDIEGGQQGQAAAQPNSARSDGDGFYVQQPN
eukprot:TRINITY_DN67094_c9_g1_i1.p1 TRINITY_DN67094_c9_g1~~TRINITY_DN67094_c9_g1_i1.p1  ORF type:complete len:146 (-),score=24.21 TRINITY_DN67094_c9_g1_i1:180-617(-)